MHPSVFRFGLLLPALFLTAEGCATASANDAEAQDSDLLGDESIASVTFDGTTYHAACVDGRKVDVPYAEYAERLREKKICAHQGPATDVWSAVGPEIQACSAGQQPASVAIAPDHLAVGCMPSGNQTVTPTVSVFDWTGTKKSTTSLRTSDGYYYTPLGLSMHGGELQVFYDYNCDDNGSFSSGWGWGCLELRELSFGGNEVRSLLWGAIGENSHPSLAFTGAEYGVLWTSYDSALFRRIDSRGLVGDPDPTNNEIVGKQPKDEREGARSAVVWNTSLKRYGAFNSFGGKLYFAELAEDGTVTRPWSAIGEAVSHAFGYDLAASTTPSGFAVAYFQEATASQLFGTIVEGGAVVKTQLLQEGGTSRTVSAFTTASGVHFVASDSANKLSVSTLSYGGELTARGVFDTTTGSSPKAAYDVGSRTLAVTWLDAAAKVHAQRYSFTK